jgi:hypothetical protein
VGTQGTRARRGVGDTFGKYTLLAPLATGGMGELFLAQMRGAAGFEKLVVIKRILPQLCHQPEFVEMFVNEARMAAQISHPNVCQIYELGKVDDRLYMALEFIEGVPLADLMVAGLDDLELCDPRLLIPLLSQVAEGLHHAHVLRGPDGSDLGLIHRDVNPKNILVTSAGSAKLLDFGVAKAMAGDAQTRSGTLKGTYAYMSPEQLRSQPLDGRSDVFSLGVVAWEALVGRRLFKRKSELKTWQAITAEPVPRVDKYRKDLPPELVDVVSIALRRQVRERYDSARQFGIALVGAIDSLGPPRSSLAIAERVERAFASQLAVQRERIAAAHRTLSPRPSMHAVDDWADDSAVATRVAGARRSARSVDRTPAPDGAGLAASAHAFDLGDAEAPYMVATAQTQTLRPRRAMPVVAPRIESPRFVSHMVPSPGMSPLPARGARGSQPIPARDQPVLALGSEQFARPRAVFDTAESGVVVVAGRGKRAATTSPRRGPRGWLVALFVVVALAGGVQLMAGELRGLVAELGIAGQGAASLLSEGAVTDAAADQDAAHDAAADQDAAHDAAADQAAVADAASAE